jgi:hypothetical protein
MSKIITLISFLCEFSNLNRQSSSVSPLALPKFEIGWARVTPTELRML